VRQNKHTALNYDHKQVDERTWKNHFTLSPWTTRKHRVCIVNEEKVSQIEALVIHAAYVMGLLI
jgi:hypothetical protein